MTSTSDAYWRTIGLSAPARRAIIAAGITQLHDLTHWRADDLAQLHGIGAHAMTRLRGALADRHLSFADENPALTSVGATTRHPAPSRDQHIDTTCIDTHDSPNQNPHRR